MSGEPSQTIVLYCQLTEFYLRRGDEIGFNQQWSLKRGDGMYGGPQQGMDPRLKGQCQEILYFRFYT